MTYLFHLHVWRDRKKDIQRLALYQSPDKGFNLTDAQAKVWN